MQNIRSIEAIDSYIYVLYINVPVNIFGYIWFSCFFSPVFSYLHHICVWKCKYSRAGKVFKNQFVSFVSWWWFRRGFVISDGKIIKVNNYYCQRRHWCRPSVEKGFWTYETRHRRRNRSHKLVVVVLACIARLSKKAQQILTNITFLSLYWIFTFFSLSLNITAGAKYVFALRRSSWMTFFLNVLKTTLLICHCRRHRRHLLRLLNAI